MRLRHAYREHQHRRTVSGKQATEDLVVARQAIHAPIPTHPIPTFQPEEHNPVLPPWASSSFAPRNGAASSTILHEDARTYDAHDMGYDHDVGR